MRVALGALRHIVPLAVVLGLPSLARAETGVPYDACSSTYVKVAATVPANVPGLFVYEGTEMPTSLVLRGSGGTTVHTSFDTTTAPFVLKVEEPLTVGETYTISWEDCGGAGSTTFVAGAAAPLPTSAGTLKVGSFTGPLECDESGVPLGFRTGETELVLDPQAKPWAGLARMDTTLDWESGLGSGIVPSGASYVGTVGYKCPYTPAVVHLTAHVHIPGVAVLDSPPLAITTSCPPKGSISCGTSEPDASVDSASDDAGDAGPSAAADKASGCQLGASRGDAGAWMLALAALLLRRRRGATSD